MIGAVVIALALAGPYAWAAGRVRGRWPALRTGAFVLGAASLAVAVGGPLDADADRTLADHMVQHLLVGTIAPALLALGAPVRLALAVTRGPGRRAIARALHSRPARVVSLPPVALALPIATLFAFHLTPLFAVALRVPAVHDLEHALLFWTSLAAWMVILGVDPLPHRISPLSGILALMALMVPMVAIGAVYMVATGVLFSHYGHGAAALADQRHGGVVMWGGGAAILVPATIAVAWRALLAEERRQRRREAAGAIG